MRGKRLFIKTSADPRDDEEAPSPLPVSPMTDSEDSWDGHDSGHRVAASTHSDRRRSFGSRRLEAFDAMELEPTEKSNKKSRAPSKSPVSPTSIQTAPTVDTEASTPSQKEQTLKIEHTVKPHNRTFQKLKKPLIALLVLLITGSTAFFFTKWLEIPGLNEQIERLQEQVNLLETQVDELELQVDRLGNEVDRLGNETDRLEMLNDELEANVDDYERQNNQLNATLHGYMDLSSQLNETVIEFAEQNRVLENQLNVYSNLNDDLNATANALSYEVDRLENVTADLLEANDELMDIVDYLANETATLSSLNQDLNITAMLLNMQVNELSVQVDELQELNLNLETLVSFLDETADDLKGTYEDMVSYLAEHITGYRVIVLETLQNLYLQRINLWDCDFRSYFLADEFIQNRTIPIGLDNFGPVVDYVDERVLSELCLDKMDFEDYLSKQTGAPPPLSSVNQLMKAVTKYTADALDYYFPNGDPLEIDLGLTGLDWAAAEYRCENLPLGIRYQHSIW